MFHTTMYIIVVCTYNNVLYIVLYIYIYIPRVILLLQVYMLNSVPRSGKRTNNEANISFFRFDTAFLESYVSLHSIILLNTSIYSRPV